MTTLFCASCAAIIWLIVRGHDEAKQAMVLVHLLHFSSIVAAVISLVLLAIVLKTRHVAPPPSITVFAVIVAVLPILAAIL